MKKITNKQRSWRVVKTPVREKGNIPILLGGLNTNLNPELIQQGFIANCDGMIIYSGLFRTDWAIANTNTTLVDNITITAAASIPECSE